MATSNCHSVGKCLVDVTMLVESFGRACLWRRLRPWVFRHRNPQEASVLGHQNRSFLLKQPRNGSIESILGAYPKIPTWWDSSKANGAGNHGNWPLQKCHGFFGHWPLGGGQKNLVCTELCIYRHTCTCGVLHVWPFKGYVCTLWSLHYVTSFPWVCRTPFNFPKKI